MEKDLQKQVSALTEEQKNSMSKVFRNFIISIVSAILIIILLVTQIFSYIEKTAIKRYNALEIERKLNHTTGTVDSELFDEVMEAMDICYRLDDIKIFLPLIIVVISCIAFLCICLIFKKKYPYFSVGNYFALKEDNK